MDKDKWSAAALQPGRKTPRTPRRAAPLCLLSVTCHLQPEPFRNTAETLTHTPSVNMSPSAAEGSGNVIIVFTARPLFKPHTCHHHGSSTYGQMEGGAQDVTSHTSCPLSSLLVFSPPAVTVLLKMWETFHVCPPAPQPLCLLRCSLASFAVQRGLVVSAGTKAALSGEALQ